ncbi:MAG: DUF2382 domain-containing protein [Chroococcidiopsidaceae cyanobacterium CP_BM_RX_35]|nr:DUF2382 domain-containing protein [Chroococcidiopsidaceae cyanobacterium CP_BM_RX_35]
MTLYKLQEFYPNYREDIFDGDDIKGLEVCAGRTGDKIGTIDTALLDESGRIRYFVIDTGFWIFGKRVLLPVGYCQIDEQAKRIYATGLLNKKQAEELPEYNDTTRIDRTYEERVREVYRSAAAIPVEVATANVASVEASAPLDITSSAVPSGYISNQVKKATDDSETYNYQQEPSVYDLNSRDHQTLKLYEERLITNKERHQTGEVVVSKHIETETARVSLPLKKERVIIERTTPTDAGKMVSPLQTDFSEGEVTRMKVYEETADIRKGAFVREEVRIVKEVQQDVIEAEETLRREELDVDRQGRRITGS